MTGSADPHEPPSVPALQWATERTPDVVMLGGPDRIYDQEAADPDWRPRTVGFAPPNGRDPLLWTGDNA